MARGPFIKWEQVIRDLVTLLGVNTPTTTRRESIADTLGIKVHALDKLLSQLRQLGVFETEAVSGGIRENGSPIRNQQYTIRMSADDILFLGNKRGVKWGSGTVPDDTKIERVPAERLDAPQATLTKVEPVVAAVGEERSDNPFAVLKPLKADSPAALIESARQYRNQHAFIDEKIAEFAEHGLMLDPAVVGLPVDERLEHIGLIVEYVTKLEGTNERLQKYANEKNVDDSLVKEYRLQIARQEADLARLAKARSDEHQEAVRLAGQHSGKVGTLTKRIEQLEQENRDLRNKVYKSPVANGAATTAVK